MYQRVFYGEVTNEKNRTLPDCDFREKLILTIMVVVIIAMGVYPQPFLRRMDRGVNALMLRLEKHSVIITDRAAPLGSPGVGFENVRIESKIGSLDLKCFPQSPTPNSLIPPELPTATAHCLQLLGGGQ